jgi:hypothetical protein
MGLGWGMAQVVGSDLPIKCNSLISNPRTTKKINKTFKW